MLIRIVFSVQSSKENKGIIVHLINHLLMRVMPSTETAALFIKNFDVKFNMGVFTFISSGQSAIFN